MSGDIRYLCQDCGLYNMTVDAWEVHSIGYPNHRLSWVKWK